MRNESSGKPDTLCHLLRAQSSNFYLPVEASPDIVLSTFCVAINKRESSLDVNYRKGVLSSQAVSDAIRQRHRVNRFVFNRQMQKKRQSPVYGFSLFPYLVSLLMPGRIFYMVNSRQLFS